VNKRDVLRRHDARMIARQNLIGDAADARRIFSPTSLWERWKTKQKLRISDAANETTEFAKDNALIIGGAFGLGAVLAASWRPLARWISEKRTIEDDNIFEDEG
jgi:hypothetical protein